MGDSDGPSLVAKYERSVGPTDGSSIRFSDGMERGEEVVGANEGVSEGSNSVVAMDGTFVASAEGCLLGTIDGNKIGAGEGALESETVEDMLAAAEVKFVATIEGKLVGLSDGTALVG